MDFAGTASPTMHIETSEATLQDAPKKDPVTEAREFLSQFAQVHLNSPLDRERLQAVINMTNALDQAVPPSEQHIARNEMLRYFEHKVRRTSPLPEAETEAQLHKLNVCLHTLDKAFELPKPELSIV